MSSGDRTLLEAQLAAIGGDYETSEELCTEGIEKLASKKKKSNEEKKHLSHLLTVRGSVRLRAGAEVGDEELFRAALADCDDALKMDEKNLVAQLRRAEIFIELGEFNDATASLKAVLDMGPDARKAAGIAASAVSNLRDEMAVRNNKEPSLGRLWMRDWLAGSPRRVMIGEIGVEIKKAVSGDALKTARTPKVDAKCSVHYHGKTRDGKVFDSSIQRNRPATFAPKQVIPGWKTVLQLMAEGDEWTVLLPMEEAYGKQGKPPAIKPMSALMFDITLVSVIDKDKSIPATESREKLREALGGRDVYALAQRRD